MVNTYQAVRLSTAEARLRPDEAVLGTRNLRSREPTERPCEQVSETSGRIGDGKELCRVAIDGIGTGVPDDLIELRSEVVVAQSSGQHIGPWVHVCVIGFSSAMN